MRWRKNRANAENLNVFSETRCVPLGSSEEGGEGAGEEAVLRMRIGGVLSSSGLICSEASRQATVSISFSTG